MSYRVPGRTPARSTYHYLFRPRRRRGCRSPVARCIASSSQAVSLVGITAAQRQYSAARVGESLETAAHSSRSGGGDPVVHPVVNEDELHRVWAVQFRFGFQGPGRWPESADSLPRPVVGRNPSGSADRSPAGRVGECQHIAGTPRGGTTGTAVRRWPAPRTGPGPRLRLVCRARAPPSPGERRLELLDIGLHIVIIAVFWSTPTAAASNKAR